MEEVLDFISKNTDLNPNDYVVIGLSGGPDSMALLNMLMTYRESIPFNIVCFNDKSKQISAPHKF